MNAKIMDCLECEAQNLNIYASAKPKGFFLMPFEVTNISNAREFADKINQVVRLVNTNSSNWPDYEYWLSILPLWFINYCKTQMSKQENNEWLLYWKTLNNEDKREAEIKKGWALADWLYWMEPCNRPWFFYSIELQDSTCVLVTVFTDENSPPVGALEWLLNSNRINGVIESMGSVSIDFN